MSMKLVGLRQGKVKPEDKDLNQLIFDVAEHRHANDIEEIHKRLRRLELFAPVMNANFEIEHGQSMTIEKGMELKIPTTMIQGLTFAAFFVNKNDPRLGDRFMGISVSEAFGMVDKTTDLAGLAFYNDRDSYFGIARQDFAALRSRYLA